MTTNECLIAPSILSADFARLGDDVTTVIQAGADLLHIDVIDNNFAPNLTFGPQVLSDLQKYLAKNNIKTIFDVHLMACLKNDIVKRFLDLNVDFITIHVEAFNDLKSLEREIDFIKNNNCKAGVSLNPETSVDILDNILEKLDLVLIMGVHPGFSGQKFINSTFDKVKLLKEKIDSKKLKTKISVDGGVGFDNIKKLAKLGAEIFVSGSNVFGADDYKLAIDKMKNLIKK
tara:strand:- start:1341 stop:2033 length:693 start_codon:yes stop_codon:yes gene_type:complete